MGGGCEGARGRGRGCFRRARSSSFRRWRSQILRAWRWGPGSGGSGIGDGHFLDDSESEAARDHRQNKKPTLLHEHFFIVGLHSNENVEAVEDALAKRKSWESEVAKSEILDLRKLQYHGCMPTLESQILFKYPPGKRPTMREHEVPVLCFPEMLKIGGLTSHKHVRFSSIHLSHTVIWHNIREKFEYGRRHVTSYDAFNSVEATFEEEFIEENVSDSVCDDHEPLEQGTSSCRGDLRTHHHPAGRRHSRLVHVLTDRSCWNLVSNSSSTAAAAVAIL